MAQMTIAATVISATQIDLRVTVGNWSGAQGYGVFYNTTGGSSKTLIYNSKTSGQVYSHKNLKLGTKYFYAVRSIVGYNASNKPLYGDVLGHTEATTLSYTPPSNPVVTATLSSDTSARITARVTNWGTPSHGVLTLTAKKDNGQFIELDSTARSSLAYTHKGLAEGSTYTYIAVAENAGGGYSTSTPVNLVVPENGRIRVRVGNEWEKGVPYVWQEGTWKKGKMYVRNNGAWNKGR